MTPEQSMRARLAVGVPSAYGLLSGACSFLPNAGDPEYPWPAYLSGMLWAVLVLVAAVFATGAAWAIAGWIRTGDPTDGWRDL